MSERRRVRPLALVLASAVVLAACVQEDLQLRVSEPASPTVVSATPPFEPPLPPTKPEPPPKRLATVEPVPRGQPRPAAEGSRTSGEGVDREAAVPTVSPLPGAVGGAANSASRLKDIVGFDRSDMITLFGEPSWVEEVPPALSLQYGTENCTLNVFLFMELSTRNFRVLSYDVTTSGNAAVDAASRDQRCFGELVNQARARRS